MLKGKKEKIIVSKQIESKYGSDFTIVGELEGVLQDVSYKNIFFDTNEEQFSFYILGRDNNENDIINNIRINNILNINGESYRVVDYRVYKRRNKMFTGQGTINKI